MISFAVTGCDNGDLNVRAGLTGELASTLAGHQAGCGITCLQQVSKLEKRDEKRVRYRKKRIRKRI